MEYWRKFYFAFGLAAILAGRWMGRNETEFDCLIHHWEMFAAGTAALLLAGFYRSR